MGQKKETLFERRQRRTRHDVKRRANGKPRLSVFRSSKHITVQIIDDVNGKTIVAASTLDKELKGKVKSGANIEAAKAVGALIADRAKKQKVSDVVFDRGGYLFHGRVKALAEAARAGGLKF